MLSSGAVRLLNLGPTAWYRTQSVYRATAECLPPDGPGGVICSQPLQPYLSHGAQHGAAEAFDLGACARLGLPVVARPLPGQPEYADVSHWLFQLVLPFAAGDDLVQRLADAALSALADLGVAAEHSGADFVTSAGASLGCLACGRLHQALVCLGCLYLAYDPAPLLSTSRLPPERACTSLWAEAPRPLSPDAVQGVVLAHLARALDRPIERDRPRVPETQAARRVERELAGQAAASLA